MTSPLFVRRATSRAVRPIRSSRSARIDPTQQQQGVQQIGYNPQHRRRRRSCFFFGSCQSFLHICPGIKNTLDDRVILLTEFNDTSGSSFSTETYNNSNNKTYNKMELTFDKWVSRSSLGVKVFECGIIPLCSNNWCFSILFTGWHDRDEWIVKSSSFTTDVDVVRFSIV